MTDTNPPQEREAAAASDRAGDAKRLATLLVIVERELATLRPTRRQLYRPGPPPSPRGPLRPFCSSDDLDIEGEHIGEFPRLSGCRRQPG